MQIFKAFFKTVRKQSMSILIYFGIFLLLTIMITSSGASQQAKTYEVTKVKIAVFDRDNSTLSKCLHDYIGRNNDIVDIKDSKESFADELYYENVQYVLIINEGFEKNLLGGKTEDIVENYQLNPSVNIFFMDSQINQFITTLRSFTTAGYSLGDTVKLSLDTAAVSTDVSMHQFSDESGKDGTYYFFLYVPYILICMLTVGLGAILITFREENLNSRILCSSVSNTERNLAMTAGCFVFSISCWVAFILLAVFMYNDNLFSVTGALYVLNSFVFLLIAMSMTYLVSFYMHTSNTLNMASNVIGLGMSFLGGIFVPLEYMSGAVITVSKFLPTYWYVQASQIVSEFTGADGQIEKYFNYIGIELGFAIAIFSAALVSSKLKKH